MLVMLVIACDRCVLTCDACVLTCCLDLCCLCFWHVFAVIVMPVMLVYAVLPVFWLMFWAISQFCCDFVF